MTRSRDRGLTLVETVVSVALVALVAVTLAAAFTVIVRTAPSAEDRADDSRSLLGLTNWLPQDVTSAEQNGIEEAPYGSTECGGVSGQELLQLTWSEAGTDFAADYRFVDDGPGVGSIVRYSCVNGGSAISNNLTSTLTKIASGPEHAPAPVDINVLVDAAAPTLALGVEFEVSVVDDSGATRELLSLDASTTNIHTTLPPSPPPPPPAGNQPPIAPDVWVNMFPGGVAYDLLLPATDPDGPAPTLIGFDPVPPVDGVTLTALGGLLVRVEVAPTALVGTTVFIDYYIEDNFGVQPTGHGHGHIAIEIGTDPTPTTSTTLPPACTASFVSVTPNPVNQLGNGQLQQDVNVVIAADAFCSGLVLSYDPNLTDSDLTRVQIPFGGGDTVTILRDAHVWLQNTPPAGCSANQYDLQLREGANGTPLATFCLELT